MHKKLVLKTFILSSLLIFTVNIATASDLTDLAYGEIYLAQPARIIEKKIDLAVNYGLGLGTPEYKLHQVLITADYWVRQYFWLGADLEFSYVKKTSLQNKLESRLAGVGYETTFEHPTQAAHIRIGGSPLQGLVNFFGNDIIPCEFDIYGLVGLVRYTKSTSDSISPTTSRSWVGTSLGLGFDQRIQFNKSYGLVLGLNSLMEKEGSKETWLHRERFSLGIFIRI